MSHVNDADNDGITKIVYLKINLSFRSLYSRPYNSSSVNVYVAVSRFGLRHTANYVSFVDGSRFKRKMVSI